MSPHRPNSQRLRHRPLPRQHLISIVQWFRHRASPPLSSFPTIAPAVPLLLSSSAPSATSAVKPSLLPLSAPPHLRVNSSSLPSSRLCEAPNPILSLSTTSAKLPPATSRRVRNPAKNPHNSQKTHCPPSHVGVPPHACYSGVMKTFLAGAALPAVLALAAGAAIVLWTSVGPAYHLEARLPGADRAGVAAPPVPCAAPEGTLTRGPGQPAALSGTWPHFRGPQFNALVTDSVPLARQWPGGAPPLLWSIELGEGYAGAAVRDGRSIVLDYDRAASADALRCLSLADGNEIWRYTYPVAVKRNHGMSRTVPAVTEDLVVALGPKCHVTCLDRRTGERRWAHRPGPGVRRHGAAVVRRAVPAGRRRPRDPRPRRRRAAGGPRPRHRQARLEEPQPTRLEDDPLVDHADGVRRPADVRLLRQGRRGRRLGRRRLDPLGHHRLEDQHRHRALAASTSAAARSSSAAATTPAHDPRGDRHRRQDLCQDPAPPHGRPVRLDPAHADPLRGPPLRRPRRTSSWSASTSTATWSGRAAPSTASASGPT